jgi:TolB-like protein/DNA-binding winged helix-turn-helix (wHTH) protein/Tfp pilus assembly protein PilF
VKPATDAPAATIYEFDDFRVDTARRLLWKGGAPMPLTPRVFDTLLYLVEHGDTVIDKERLMEAVWPDSIVEENNLTQNISTLRRIFGEKPGSHRFIVTVPGRGYRFVADLRMVHGADGSIPTEAGDPGNETAVVEQAPSVLAPPLRKYGRVLVAALAVLLLALGVFLFSRTSGRSPSQSSTQVTAPAVAPPEKSIAVLPFANLSDEKENAFFTEGVQDDILTALAKLADLKVISRTSVSNYAAGPGRDLRAIGQELGVANILEGSVRRVGGKVRVTAQLIEMRTNTHLWAETYDRELTDVFAIQSDIAQQIAAALKAKLAPEEKTRLDARPTSNPDAYVLYLTALGMDERAADKLFMQAIALDPGFALAYARASISLSRNAGDDPALKARARAQAQEAMRLAPSLGEAHLALGLCLYWGEKKYDTALKEFEIAAATLPNSAEIPTYVGGIYRRQGRWRDATASFARAQALDPRSHSAAFLAANHYLFMREWDAAAAGYKRSLEVGGDPVLPHLSLAYLEVARNADPAAARRVLDKVPAGSTRASVINLGRWDLAMLERDYDAAEKALTDVRFDDVAWAIDAPKTFYQGRTALARGDIESARRYLEATTVEFEDRVRNDPNAPQSHAALGLVYAYRQMKEEAIRESRRAIELEPETQNAYHGAIRVANLALVFALVGESDQAVTLLEHLLAIPGPLQGLDFPQNITVGDLRLRWEWDRLRNHPRFQKILAGPEPKTVY